MLRGLTPQRVWRRFSVVASVAVALLVRTEIARGQSDAAGAANDAADDSGTPAAQRTAEGALEAGAFAPFSLSARSDTQRALAMFQGGYDSALNGSVFRAAAEVQLAARLSVRGGGSYLGAGRLQPDVALKVDALRQESHGVDLAAVVGYEALGFNVTPAVVVRAAVGRTLDHTRLTANVGYGAGTREGERYGDLRLAAMQRLSRGVHLGLDSRLRVDLERDSNEPAGEAEWEVNAGPAAAVSLGRFVLTGGAGASAMKHRLIGTRSVGLFGLMGLGAVF